jgi:hypothetical protein
VVAQRCCCGHLQFELAYDVRKPLLVSARRQSTGIMQQSNRRLENLKAVEFDNQLGTLW